jgi:flagellar biosynthesis/type III secretory pathway chaperone
MQEIYHHIFSLARESTRLANELSKCLDEEQKTLVEFRVEELPQVTLRKESLFLSIVRKRQELKRFMKFHFNVEKDVELIGALAEPYRSEWRALTEQWTQAWQTLSQVCEQNQNFLKNSLKNLGLLADNLKRLLGDSLVYSPQGKRVDLQSAGKVVRASF